MSGGRLDIIPLPFMLKHQPAGMRPPIGSEFRLYFERTLGVGCGVGVLLALPAVVLALLFLLWAPA